MDLLNWGWTMTDWALLISILCPILYYYGTRKHDRFSKHNIPYLKPLPFVGNCFSLIFKGQQIPSFVLDIYKKLEGHACAGIFMFTQPVLMVRDPKLMKDILIKDFEHFTDHEEVVSKKMDPMWAKALPSLKGQQWKEMRSTLSPAFTSSKMKTMFLLVSECCQQLVNFLQECEHKPNGCNITKENGVLVMEMKDLFTRYTSDVIATTAFGVEVDSLKEPNNEFFVRGLEGSSINVWKFLAYLNMPTLSEWLGIKVVPDRVTKFFSSLVMEAIATREQNGIVRPDMLHLLMQAKKGTLHDDEVPTDHNNIKKRLTDEDVLAQARMFFLVGFDTSSILLCFTMYALAEHTDVQTRLQEEIDKSLEDNGGRLTYDSVNSMKYLDMIVSETLRLYPPAASMERVCTKSYTLKTDPPIEIKQGDNVHFCLLGMHRDPNYFPDPDRFDPERFSDENKHNIVPMTYTPFGVGPRGCIGNRFALMQTKLALVYVLSKFRVKQVEKTPKPPVMIQKGFVISLKGGFWLGLESRY